MMGMNLRIKVENEAVYHNVDTTVAEQLLQYIDHNQVKTTHFSKE